MKKLLLFAFAITTILGFVSCGTNNSSQKNVASTDSLKQAIDSVSSANSLYYVTNYEEILKSDTDITTTISTTENKSMKDPFVMWTKGVTEINAELKQPGESYLKATGNGIELSVRIGGTEWQKTPPNNNQAQTKIMIDFSESFIKASCYLLSANLDSFKMDDNQDGLIKYSGTISQSSVVETYKQCIRDIFIDTNLIRPDKEIPDDLLKEITSGKIPELMAGIPSLAFTDKPIPVTIWVNEKNNTITKVEIDKTNVMQAIFDKFPLKDKVRKVEKAILTYKVIGINTFDEIPMPE
ncbi:MAG: hypothetical protein JJE17_03250 [Peptostreptococcaceae bacterium]|nr:hypothetical protein [Peptostreptococcaceae bacterium]